MKVLKIVQTVAVVFVLSSCWLPPPEREDVKKGVVAGTTELLQTVPRAVTAMETGGWTAALITLIFGAVRGVQKGLRASRERLVSTTEEGVKRANGGSTP